MPDHFSKLRLAIPPVTADDVLHGVAVVMDEIRSMEASFDELSQIASKIGAHPIFYDCDLEPKNEYWKIFETACRPTCDLCCHYQAHPPRCQLSKRSISPKQFSCKKYSPKHNSRK